MHANPSIFICPLCAVLPESVKTLTPDLQPNLDDPPAPMFLERRVILGSAVISDF